jgi:hypothetical protein
LAVLVQEGLVVATEVVGSAVPPPPAVVDDSREERVVAETTALQMMSDPQVETGSGDDDVVMVSAEQVIPPPPPASDHEAITLAETETPTPATAPTGGGAAEASVSGAWSTINLGVIDLDATELPCNDWDIYEVVLECMLADPVKSEIDAPKSRRLLPRPLLKRWHQPMGNPCRTLSWQGNPR